MFMLLKFLGLQLFVPVLGFCLNVKKKILSQLKAIDNTHALRVHQLIRGRDLCYLGKTLEVDLFFSPRLVSY